MPIDVIKSFSKKTGKSVNELEKLWKKAKAIAKEEGHEEEYDYIMGIFKKMIGIKEHYTLNILNGRLIINNSNTN